jgi:hypothetical protein
MKSVKTIEYNDNEVTLLHGELRLSANCLMEHEVLLSYESARINESEWEIESSYDLIVTVASDSWLILNHSLTAPSERVEER